MIRSATLFAILLSISIFSFAQETIKVTDTYFTHINEKYYVLKSDNQTKQGLYQAYYKRDKAIASGEYTNGKRSGTWNFFDQNGNVIQQYNYDAGKLRYENLRDTDTWIEYDVAKKANDSTKVTLPVRIGGKLFGYLPYLKQFKLAREYNTFSVYGILQILVSPAGRLAECKLLIKTKRGQNIIDSYSINPETLSEDDKRFVPATVNNNGVATTLYIYCYIEPDFTVSMYKPKYPNIIMRL